LLAPAKINVTLEILARRDDGYHTLRSVMLPIGLYDRITLEPAATAEGSFAVDAATGDGSELARDNLVMRALAACGLAHAYDVRLEKRVPVGGGLGGGSSDAASVLRAAMTGAIGPAQACDWNAAARSLGSDVPFFLAGTGALVEGTGERVTPIGALPPWWVVVVRPHASVATADAYRLLASLRERDGAPATRARGQSASLAAIDALQRGAFADAQAALVNDFHDPISAAYPAVARATEALARAGATRPLLSGSGSCVFALFESERAAQTVRDAFEASAAEATYVAPLHHDPAWRG
jgi:4-diphosphocytidyl-2-C-methyl-D-erythritol kinase